MDILQELRIRERVVDNYLNGMNNYLLNHYKPLCMSN